MVATFSAPSSTCNCRLLNPPIFNGDTPISRQISNYQLQFIPKCVKRGFGRSFPCSSFGEVKAVNGGRAFNTTSWDEKPYEVLAGGKRVYLDEQDVVTFLEPPKELIPLNPSSYNPASYLWKKISDIPEERRHRLLYLLEPRLISAAWEVAGARYDDAKLANFSSSSLLAGENNASSLEYWNCRKSGGPMPIALINYVKKALFRKDAKIYGRLIAEHPWPFNDQVVIYIRHLGPGVMVGQAWQEGLALEQVPRKLCGEILMVKDYAASR